MVAIRLFTGLPGTGKTYRVVRDILRDSPDRYYHNVDGFRLGHPVRWGQDTFNEDWVREHVPAGSVLVLDEAQMLLGRKDAAFLRLLSYHRHLGIDVWLVCQNRRMLHGDYVALVEVEIRAKPRVGNMMVYQWSVAGESYRVEVIRVDSGVFDAYKSFEFGGASSHKSKMPYFIGLCMVCAVGIFFLGLRSLSAGVGPAPSRETAAATSPVRGGDVREDSFCEEMDRIREWSPWCVVHVGSGFLRSTWGEVRHLVEVFPGYRLEQRGGRLKSVWLVGIEGEVEAQLGGLL